ncbi:hypothetical protein MTO96_044982 [Rhipicephalus appendiculatus]
MADVLEDVCFTDYVDVDSSAVVCGALTDDDIICQVRSAEPVAASDDDEEEDEAPVWPSAAEVMAGLNAARLFLSFEEGGEEAFRQIRSSLPVTSELIRIKAIELARESGLTREQFKGSIYWVRRFMRRKGFALRRRTSICQKLPEAYEDKLVEFQRYVIRLRQQHGYMLGQIGNADETPVWFDMPSSTTVCERASEKQSSSDESADSSNE